jgi:hypothetical protein
VYDQASKGWQKRVTLWEAILLSKMVQGAVRLVEDALIWLFEHEIKIMNEGVKRWLRFKGLKGGLAGHLVPTVNEVHKSTSSVGWEAVS